MDEVLMLLQDLHFQFVVPRLSRKRGTLKLIRLSVPLSVCPSVCMSVTKTLTWLISSEVLMIEHLYLACIILVTSSFNLHHAGDLDLLQGQSCCRAGDENSPNLLVACIFEQFLYTLYSFVLFSSRCVNFALNISKVSSQELH